MIVIFICSSVETGVPLDAPKRSRGIVYLVLYRGQSTAIHEVEQIVHPQIKREYQCTGLSDKSSIMPSMQIALPVRQVLIIVVLSLHTSKRTQCCIVWTKPPSNLTKPMHIGLVSDNIITLVQISLP